MTATSPRYQAIITCAIVKADDDEKRLVTGIVLQPDVEDAHGDTVTADVIEKAAHDFIAKYNEATKLGVQHTLFGAGIELAESYIAPEETTIGGQLVLKGTWIMTTKVLDDELWAGVKDGSLTGYSIGAIATVPATSDDDEQADLQKSAANDIEVTKSRPLLALVVKEVSLVDAAANERKFLVTKSLVQDDAPQEIPMADPQFTVTTDVSKDMDKLKKLSKAMAMERLTMATSMIEELKKGFSKFTDVSQLWKAVDDIHGVLYPVENDIGLAVFKSEAGDDGTLFLVVPADVKEAIAKALGEQVTDDAALIAGLQAEAVVKAVKDALNDDSVGTYLTEVIDATKAKSITPKRLDNLGVIAANLSEAIAEMSTQAAEAAADTEDTDVDKSEDAPEAAPATAPAFDMDAFSALLDAKLEPVTKRLAALEEPPAAEPAVESAEVIKAKATEELVVAKAAEAAAIADSVRLQKQLDDLEAGASDEGDDDQPAASEPAEEANIWKSIVHQTPRRAVAPKASVAK